MTTTPSLDEERNTMHDRSKLQIIEDFKKLCDVATVTDAPHQKAELLQTLPDISALDMDSIALLLRLLIQKHFPAFSVGQYGTNQPVSTANGLKLLCCAFPRSNLYVAICKNPST